MGLPWIPVGRHWAPFGRPWSCFWPPLGCLGAPLGSLWLPLGGLGVPCGCFPEILETGDLVSYEVTCLSTKTRLLEHATGAAGATGAGEVGQELWLGAHLPHAPGARMTVVTQTPSNYIILYYIISYYIIHYII